MNYFLSSLYLPEPLLKSKDGNRYVNLPDELRDSEQTSNEPPLNDSPTEENTLPQTENSAGLSVTDNINAQTPDHDSPSTSTENLNSEEILVKNESSDFPVKSEVNLPMATSFKAETDAESVTKQDFQLEIDDPESDQKVEIEINDAKSLEQVLEKDNMEHDNIGEFSY